MRVTFALVMLLALMLALAAGCGSQPQWEPSVRQDLFRPAAMRIHPVFTQVRSWSGSGKPDGIELLLEFQDQFGDAAKASGDAVFEVFEFRPGYPDPRGARLVPPFLTTTANVAAQRDHWSRTSRCYIFQLAWPEVDPRRPIVVTATFEMTGGGRFFDTIVLDPVRPVAPTPAPATAPGARTPRP
jgi:hypothetical protein